MKTPEILLPALRQYCHNTGEGLLPGFDHDETVKIIQSLEGERDRLKKKLKEIWEMFYGQNMQVAGWHLNGDLEPIDKFFDDNDWDYESTAQPEQKETK